MQNYPKKKYSTLFLLKKSIDKKIIILTKTNKKIKGKLFSFDSFFNLVLKIDHHQKFESQLILRKKKETFFFIRGDQVILLKFIQIN